MNSLPMNPDAVLCLALLAFVGLASAGTPALPSIPAYTTNVTQAPYNARGDGTTTNTMAIQNAINDVSAKGGGTVEIPGPGVYQTGPLTMKSKINLQVDAGATLKMLPYSTWYPTWTTTPLLSLASLHDIEISGGGGIDGQGADWWSNKPGTGLYMIYFTSCNTVLVQNVTFSNAPAQQLVFKSSKCGNITIQGITIRAPSSHAGTPSHNTDGIDLVGTNCLVQNCTISTGDDDIALGSSTSGVVASDILVTNCSFSDGHGMTIGGNTAGGVSNLTVINCTFNGTDYGIRMKSDNATNSPGAGGVAQNLAYYNLYMTNLGYAPIAIHSYYNPYHDPIGISPSTAASQTIDPVTANTPIWRNILISNLTATVASGGQAGIIWGRTEMPAANITLCKLNITAPANFDLYNANGIQFVDSQIKLTLPGGNTFSLYNAQVTITNSVPVTNVFSLDGLISANSVALYNARGAMGDSSALGANPITLSASTLSNSTSLALPGSSGVDFVVGTNNDIVAVAGNLALGSTLNITNGGGFGVGTYVLFTYSGGLSGNPILGARPPGYSYSLNTNTTGQVNLVVSTSSSPPSITNQPAGQIVLAGSNATFTVGAAGTVPLGYQWRLNATNSVAGGTNVSLIISNAQPSNAGGYFVIVTNTYGSATSSTAVLQVFTTAAATLNSLVFSTNKQFGFNVTGVPGFSYAVQASTNLVDWTSLVTNTSPFSLMDTDSELFSNRFYRAVCPP
jgi:polygalacturonase